MYEGTQKTHKTKDTTKTCETKTENNKTQDDRNSARTLDKFGLKLRVLSITFTQVCVDFIKFKLYEFAKTWHTCQWFQTST